MTTEETISTHIKGVEIKKDPEVKEVKLSQKETEEFLNYNRLYAQTSFGADKLSERMDELKEKIIEVVEKNEGIRGVISKKDGFDITIYPRTKTESDLDALLDSLGDMVYASVVNPEVRIVLSYPHSYVTKKGVKITAERIIEAFQKALSDLGITQKEQKPLLGSEKKANVNWRKINKMEREGKVEISEEARRIIQTGWGIRPSRIEKKSNNKKS